ncbi:MAG TPA: hypothetical protein VLH19_02060 [Patescibacteria group bacterium]|nr:hypothetical protein [Patescibacteria group bacterium]
MFTLIVLLIIGTILAYFSQSNLMPVSLHAGAYTLSNVPLFYVIVGSLLTGLVLSYFIYSIHEVTLLWKLRGKDSKIKRNKNEVLELTKRVHQLELENEKLRHAKEIEPRDTNAL